MENSVFAQGLIEVMLSWMRLVALWVWNFFQADMANGFLSWFADHWKSLALTLIGSIRELVGNGSIFGISLLGASYQPMLLIILPAGGFLVFGSLLGIINAIGNKRKKGAKA